MQTRPSPIETPEVSHAEITPRLLFELPSRRSIFFGNLWDLLLRRQPPVIPITSLPAPFWPDVFVTSGVRWSRFFESISLHVLAVAALVTAFSLVRGIQQQRNPDLQLHDKVVYYHVSEFLPAFETGTEEKPRERRPPRKADPLPAKQKIISLPPNHDNTEQTIVDAPEIKLKQHVNLPNIVAVNQAPLPVPTAVATRDISKLTVPVSPTAIIAPPPDPVQRELSRTNLADFQTKAVEPQPSVDPSKLLSRRIDIATAVVQPPPTVDRSKLNDRRIDLGNPAIVPPPPAIDQAKLDPRRLTIPNAGVVQPPPAVDNVRRPVAASSARQLSALGGAVEPVPPPPSMQQATNLGTAKQLIALSVNPDIKAPVEPPHGSRSGEFAVGPEGRPGATGSPEIKSSTTGNSSSAPASAPRRTDLPPGIVVGAPPPNSSTRAGTPTPSKPNGQPSLLAMAHLPAIPDVSHRSTPSPQITEPSRIERRVFGDKRSYSMVLNMPNLGSAGGSWVIHFAQLEDDRDSADISAPVPTLKVDPAYPAALRREMIEGTVILYAVIHKDGTVSDVRVLRSVQTQLDESAKSALLHWHFNPGTKKGEAVDLEAVVQVPFKLHALPF
ncbi:MAG TPA: TonB family protein [Terriglobales bacterium]|nr:TonB family protein [Terriglobales bacterium]